MIPRDWLLIYLAIDLSDRSERLEMDPIRIMKGLFLGCQEGPILPNECYEFEPYSYGPCSFQIYDDLDDLVRNDLVYKRIQQGQTWPLYSSTEFGDEQASELVKSLPSDSIKSLAKLKKLVIEMPFMDLLNYVYSRYPAMAQNSVFKPLDHK